MMELRYCEPWGGMARYSRELCEFYGKEWNPLHDDGDALRLAVTLGIGVLFDVQDEKITAYQQQPHDGYNVEFAGDDGPRAATRRAIVRAAAAMVEKP